VNVHQVLSGAGPHDAVTAQARAFRELFGSWGWGGADHAAAIDPRARDVVRPLRELGADGMGDDDVLLLHYSAYAPKLRAVLARPQRKLLLSHNITPARFFWDHDAQTAVQCALGRRQLPAFAAACDAVAGVSAYNARELGSEDVVPILFEAGRLGPPGPPRPAVADGAPTLLFVGRLTPHKRQDALIRTVALLRRGGAPGARLVLVGEPLTPAYGVALRALADDLAPGAVTIESGLSGAQLAERYRAADVLVVLSEHEGFCIPLLEAFHFGVPVVARAAGGIPEVAGDAALLLGDGDGEDVAAQLALLAATDDGLRAALRERAAARLVAYAPRPTAQRLRAWITRSTGPSGPSPASSGPRPAGRAAGGRA
jgi:glycosyltransferase involved in cell wall biosynthesis